MPTDAILLLGGSGSRLSSLSKGVNKHALALYDRSAVEIAVRLLQGLGSKRIIAVVRPKDVALLFDSMNLSPTDHTNIAFVPQPEPRGTGDAVSKAARVLQEGEAWLLFGDCLFLGGSGDIPNSPLPKSIDIRCYVRWLDNDNIKNFAVVETDGHTGTIVDKTHGQQRGFVTTGLYVLRTEAINEYYEDKTKFAGNEREVDIISFIQHALDAGRCELTTIDTPWFDIGHSVEALWCAASAVRSRQVPPNLVDRNTREE